MKTPIRFSAASAIMVAACTFAAEWGMTLETLLSMPNALWLPSECPLCGYGVPLDNVQEEPDSEVEAPK